MEEDVSVHDIFSLWINRSMDGMLLDIQRLRTEAIMIATRTLSSLRSINGPIHIWYSIDMI